MAKSLVCPNCDSGEGFKLELAEYGSEGFVITRPTVPGMIRKQRADEVELDLVCKSCRVVVWAAYWPSREGLIEELTVLVKDQRLCAIKGFT